ncbi:MAG: sensor domain-containing diguanylate cyclase [Oscillospiraceae bacterium]|nr:sensor domain-containing diguanylate cyclase [Oscillospiraceae bacterium]
MNDITRDAAELLRENEELRKACETAQNTGRVYTHIAHALARDYTDLFYVNMDTNEYIEYHTDDRRGVLVESRRAADFFESCGREAKLYVHSEDQDAFVTAMNRDFLTETLDRFGIFMMTYRRIKDGRLFYVQMKVSRMEDDRRFIVIAVSDIDELVMKRRAEDQVEEERMIYARLHAITGNFLVVYVVDPGTDRYREFSSTEDYSASVSQAKAGNDFFETVRKMARQNTYPADLRRFLAVFTKENMMSDIVMNGIFSFGFRFMMKGKPLHVQLKAAMVEEKEGPRLIVGLNDIDAQVRQEEELEKRLLHAQSQANIDALTGVRNKHAYLEAEAHMDRRIADHVAPPFAVVVMDMNDLKKINDTAGHQAGDQCLRDACRIICDIFKHSPVFRTGGDEFAVIVQGTDYSCLEERIGKMRDHNLEALESGGIVIACGMARYEEDSCVATVFDRADHRMYEDKARLKAGIKEQ